MPRVLVWKCPHSGKLFEDEKKYKTHLGRLAAQRREQRKISIELNKAQAWWTEIQNIEMDIKDLPKFIIANQKHFWAEAARSDPWDWKQVGTKRKGVIMPVPELVEFTEFDMIWNERVSNSHSCPHNGVTNWDGTTKLSDGTPAPRGYPGWTGRIGWRSKWPKEYQGIYLSSDLFNGRLTRIHTGTGGGGAWADGMQKHAYGVSIFAADWPGLNRYREKKYIWETLGGKL